MRNYWHALGPGLTTGAADDDPSGIATYSQAGARFGFSFLWTAPFSFPLMAIVQEMCARIGLVTGRGLAANIKHFFPRWVLYSTTTLLFFANTINIGADLGAMAKATQLLVSVFDFKLLVLFFALFTVALEILLSYKTYAKYLKWLSLVLIAYILSALSVKLDWGQVIKDTIVPAFVFSKGQIFMLCAILGTTISPYLFFWQTSQEVEEEILEGRTTLKLRQEEVSNGEISSMRKDVWSGMFFSNLVMFFIIAAGAATLFSSGITNIKTASDAALALKPIAGDFAFLLFAAGIVGTGLLAIPILAGSCSYAICESVGWKFGLYKKPQQAKAFYGIIAFSTALGVVMNFLGIDPIQALIFSAVVNGLVSPVVLVLIVLLSGSNRVMGARTNRPVFAFLGWAIVGIMGIVALLTLVSPLDR